MPLPPHALYHEHASAFALGGVTRAPSCTQDEEDQRIVKPHRPKLSWMTEKVETPAPSGKSMTTPATQSMKEQQAQRL